MSVACSECSKSSYTNRQRASTGLGDRLNGALFMIANTVSHNIDYVSAPSGDQL
ncbi:hypothetical protein Tcan_05681 [Toxocara canis]|uniref:Uncharacterized protein n=1 Tax=Toxocara canis TaxID=6265 RepID=A0A0B2W5T0_TOXCA|nr:hypothetical protein Tcan_05681 [Toxocara canis]